MIDRTFPLPAELAAIFETHQTPDAVFINLMPTLANMLNCGRCFLYLRNPETKVGKVAYCWRRESDYPDVTDPDWKPEPDSLPKEDPLFAAALRTEPSIFVEDVETASPNVVNLEFERKYLGHRALVHAHLRQDGKLWGILQPSVFGEPRTWTDADRTLIEQVVDRITPLAIEHIKASGI
jgi:GAF domain-containing protein